MQAIPLLISLAATTPAAGDTPNATVETFARECPAGQPKRRKFDDATFAAAASALRARADLVPRAWAVTCESVILCSQQTSADSCLRIYGASGPQGTPVNGGELMVLVEFASDHPQGRGLYAIRAKDAAKKFGFYNGWALPGHAIAVVQGPTFD